MQYHIEIYVRNTTTVLYYKVLYHIYASSINTIIPFTTLDNGFVDIFEGIACIKM